MIRGTITTSIYKTKSLRTIIDQNLNLNLHLEYLKKNSFCVSLFVMRRSFFSYSTDVLLLTYYVTFYPYLFNEVQIWGAESSRTLYILEFKKKLLGS